MICSSRRQDKGKNGSLSFISSKKKTAGIVSEKTLSQSSTVVGTCLAERVQAVDRLVGRGSQERVDRVECNCCNNKKNIKC